MPILRVLGFILATVLLAVAFWSALFVFGIYVLDSPTPECTDSDTCDTYGQVLWDFGGGWPAFLGCVLLSGGLVWLAFRLARRKPQRPGPYKSKGHLP